MTDKAKKYKEKRAAEKVKKEAKNREKTIARDVVTEAKVIAAKV